MLSRLALIAAFFVLPYPYAAAPPPVPAVPTRALPVIACFGDSITAGPGIDPGHTWPDDLQADLDRRGYHYKVVNAGISGNTSKDGVDRLQDVLRLHPAIVIVEFGGNDGLRGLPIADTRPISPPCSPPPRRQQSRPRRHHPTARLWLRLHPALQRDFPPHRGPISHPAPAHALCQCVHRPRRHSGRRRPPHSKRRTTPHR